MPNREEHCRHSFEMYGVRAEDVHAWMDEPSKIYGPRHRHTRHDLKLIPMKFVEKYGEELARAIMLDHILLDGGNLHAAPVMPIFRSEERASDVLATFSLFVWALFLIGLFSGFIEMVWLPWWAAVSVLWFCCVGPLLGMIAKSLRRTSYKIEREEDYLEMHR